MPDTGIETLFRATRTLGFAAFLLLLAGCAGSSTAPTVVQELPSDQRATLHLADVSTDAAAGVAITPEDLARITQLVTAEIRAAAPSVLEPAPQAKLMRLTVTRYDAGNAVARFMLAGLGQIHVDCDVTLTDPQTRQSIGQYKVSKTFAFGGIYGGVTNIQDVEKGLAKSIADIVKPKT